MRVPTVSLSLRARVCHPNTRTYVRLLGPCFKTGPWQGFRPRIKATKPGPRHDGREGVSRRRNDATSPSAVYRTSNRREPRTPHRIQVENDPQKMRHSDTPCNGFPFSGFRHSLTLFSKFFASFPHGTCSLSVSRQYLALEGIYLPLRAAVPSNSTLRKNGVRAASTATNGTVTLHGSLFQGNWTARALPRLLETTIQSPQGPGFST